MDLSEGSDEMALHEQRETMTVSSIACSGGTFLREILEKITGTLTGSDIDLEHDLFVSL